MKALIAVALVLSSSAGLAQESVQNGAAVSAPVKIKPICRSEAVTGSNFPKRTCHSKEQWAAIDAATAVNTDRMLASRRASGNTGH